MMHDEDELDARGWLNKGVVYAKQGDLDKAIEAFHKALAFDHEDAKSWYNLGIAYGKKGDPDRSIEAHRKAVDLDPEYAMAWHDLGSSWITPILKTTPDPSSRLCGKHPAGKAEREGGGKQKTPGKKAQRTKPNKKA